VRLSKPASVVEMAVQTVTRARNRALVAVLREAEGRRVLGVGVGRSGAAAVLCGLRHVPPVRPVLWLALLRAVEGLGGRIVRSFIDQDEQGRPHAFFDVLGVRGVVEVPCSTEDAVAIACLAGTPLFVPHTLLGRHRPWYGPA